MNDDGGRPDPDRLLRRVNDEAEKARRAKLKLTDQHSEEGWLAIYERSVQPLNKGAALVHPK